MSKQAVGYINFRAIDINDDIAILVQNRYADIESLKSAIKGIKNRRTKKATLGNEYDKKNILITIEEICVASEYGKYLNNLYGDKEVPIRYGRSVLCVLREGKVFDIVHEDDLSLSDIEKNRKLSEERIALKSHYDSLCGTEETVEKRTKSELLMELDEKRLDKVVEFAKLNSLEFNKASYINAYQEIKWRCKNCGLNIYDNFKKMKQRKYPCRHCVKQKIGDNKCLIQIKNVDNFASENNINVNTSSYIKELGALSRLWWYCKHGEKELVTVQAMKRRARVSDGECLVCRRKVGE